MRRQMGGGMPRDTNGHWRLLEVPSEFLQKNWPWRKRKIRDKKFIPENELKDFWAFLIEQNFLKINFGNPNFFPIFIYLTKNKNYSKLPKGIIKGDENYLAPQINNSKKWKAKIGQKQNPSLIFLAETQKSRVNMEKTRKKIIILLIPNVNESQEKMPSNFGDCFFRTMEKFRGKF
jgi:hypothetical protein